ncbi:hypothetical protein OBBRIDRAFT_806682 [Obba rivulosa]|uniref:Uncharacterized protein n=1 Tax=Obba rivulosa TaxID=1052685 RepID=A0A8E2AWA4_9APHY|nr:hypothetical protein OBBRIDRAFT_806682 [Obba rivulosa]
MKLKKDALLVQVENLQLQLADAHIANAEPVSSFKSTYKLAKDDGLLFYNDGKSDNIGIKWLLCNSPNETVVYDYAIWDLHPFFNAVWMKKSKSLSFKHFSVRVSTFNACQLLARPEQHLRMLFKSNSILWTCPQQTRGGLKPIEKLWSVKLLTPDMIVFTAITHNKTEMQYIFTIWKDIVFHGRALGACGGSVHLTLPNNDGEDFTPSLDAVSISDNSKDNIGPSSSCHLVTGAEQLSDSIFAKVLFKSKMPLLSSARTPSNAITQLANTFVSDYAKPV